MSTSSREPELRTGDVFGGYQIVRPLGSGGYGAVYEALRQPLRKRTALKVLHREHTHDQDLLDRFLREAQIVGQLEHPHIVSVFDVGVHDNQPYIAMELLDGESLAAVIDRGGPMAIPVAVDLMLPVLSAMAVVHAQGIVHRDLKPDNIFLARPSTGGTVPKLLDFGIAKARDAGRSLTVTRSIMGTPNYMSPEQARESKHVDGQSDQWALAVILFECLTGRCPFQGENLLDLLTTITSGPIPRLREVRPELPEGLDAALARAMERSPEARWPSVKALGAALLPFASDAARAQWTGFFGAARTATVEIGRASTLQTHPAPATPREETLSPATRSSDHPPRRSSWQRIGLVAAVACAVGITGIGGLSLRTPSPPAPAPITVVRPQRRAPAATPARAEVAEAVTANADAGTHRLTVAPAVVAAPVVMAAPVVAEEAPEAEAPSRHHRHHHAHGRHGAASGGDESMPNL